jgi:hypothetical protein
MLALLTDRYSLVLTDTKADVAIPMHRYHWQSQQRV